MRKEQMLRWSRYLQNMGVPSNEVAKAINLADKNRWILPGHGTMSTDAANTRLRNNLKKHLITVK